MNTLNVELRHKDENGDIIPARTKTFTVNGLTAEEYIERLMGPVSRIYENGEIFAEDLFNSVVVTPGG